MKIKPLLIFLTVIFCSGVLFGCDNNKSSASERVSRDDNMHCFMLVQEKGNYIYYALSKESCSLEKFINKHPKAELTDRPSDDTTRYYVYLREKKR